MMKSVVVIFMLLNAVSEFEEEFVRNFKLI